MATVTLIKQQNVLKGQFKNKRTSNSYFFFGRSQAL